jgi:hypothetical protein
MNIAVRTGCILMFSFYDFVQQELKQRQWRFKVQ